MEPTGANADRIGKELEEDYLPRSSRDPETLESLISLAEDISKVLVPVEPVLSFRDWLRDQLSAVVRRRLAWRVILLSENHRWAFVLGAALGFLVPLVGMVGYLLCLRLMGRPLDHAQGNSQTSGLR
jgi:hypothetical protein